MVVLGDANVGPGYGQALFALMHRLKGVREIADTGLVTWDTQNPLVRDGLFPHEPSAWIDHVFARAWAGSELRQTALDLGVSDHYAVQVTGSSAPTAAISAPSAPLR